MKNRFIVVEGLDGSGKSTQIKMLKEYLESMGEKVFMTAEPSEGRVGKTLREMLSEDIPTDMYFQAGMFLADRIDHCTNPVNGIKKMLEEGYTVISDRYYYSTFAYQGTKSDMDYIMKINLDCPAILKPDVCIFLDLNPEICKGRIDTNRGKTEMYEKNIEVMKSIRKNFLDVLTSLKDRENIKIINAEGSIEDIQKAIREAVEE
ncbi:MAG: dTMP kinase [Clostridia bacterium]|nr:dTMP kinase [Clostridia bacterium]